MKTTFTKEYILENSNFYTHKEIMDLPFINNDPITLEDIFNSEIPLKDKYWFLIGMCCCLRYNERVRVAVNAAEIVLPIFEESHPRDDRPRKAIELTKRWLAGEDVSREELRKAAEDAYAAEDAHTAFAAHAAAFAAFRDAYAAARAAIYAAAKTPEYTQKLTDYLMSYVKKELKE